MRSSSSFSAVLKPADLVRKQDIDLPSAESFEATDSEKRPALITLAETMARLDTRPPYSPVVTSGLMRLAEFVLLCAAGAAPSGRLAPSLLIALAGALVVSAASRLLHMNALAMLRRPMGPLLSLIPIWLSTCVAVCGLLRALMGSGGPDLQSLLAVCGVGCAALLTTRLAAAGWIRRLTDQGRFERRTVVVGGGEPGGDLLQALSQRPDADLRILGVFDDRNDKRSPDFVGGYPKLGSVSDLVGFARRARIDLIIFALPITAEERLLQMLRKLWVLPIDIRLAAHRSGLRFRPRSYSYVGDVPVLDVFDRPIADWDIVIKAVFDRVVGAILLLVFSPVLLVTALAVKLDSPGPVLFRQKRHGFNNETVEVLKFRSLYADQTDHTAAKQVTKDDPRVTRVGRFIRKTSLDELPQLINVALRGDLSLVGPRPHAVHAQLANKRYDDVVDGYFARHRVKPGVTGWAQVNGWRGETDTPLKIQRRVEHDLEYIENWSIFFDIYILLRTPIALIRAENAY